MSAKEAKNMENTQAVLPPLYKKPVPLSMEKHGKYSLKEVTDYSVAKEIGSCALNYTEFGVACTSMPIVFAGDKEMVPLAIMSLKDGMNLLIDEKGQWKQGSYIPAYVRRYPFVLMEDRAKNQMILGVDEMSDMLVSSDVRPLFKDGEKTPLLERAINFCTAFQREFERSKLFVKALQDHDLLVDRVANIRTPDGEDVSVGGFKVVDQQKLEALSDDVILDFKKKGFLPAIYTHLVSLNCWSQLAIAYADKKQSAHKDHADKVKSLKDKMKK